MTVKKGKRDTDKGSEKSKGETPREGANSLHNGDSEFLQDAKPSSRKLDVERVAISKVIKLAPHKDPPTTLSF